MLLKVLRSGVDYFTNGHLNYMNSKDESNSYLRLSFRVSPEHKQLMVINNEFVFCSNKTYDENKECDKKIRKDGILHVYKDSFIKKEYQYEEDWVGSIRFDGFIMIETYLQEELFDSLHEQLNSNTELEYIYIAECLGFGGSKQESNQSDSEIKFGPNGQGNHLIWNIHKNDKWKRLGLDEIRFHFKHHEMNENY